MHDDVFVGEVGVDGRDDEGTALARLLVRPVLAVALCQQHMAHEVYNISTHHLYRSVYNVSHLVP